MNDYNKKYSNTPIEGMWVAVSVLQMMSYLALIDLNFPENLLTFLSYVESVHNFNQWFPNPFTYLVNENNMDMTPYTEQFEKRGFTNRNMIYLCGSDLALMALNISVILLLMPLANIIPYFHIFYHPKDSHQQFSKN